MTISLLLDSRTSPWIYTTALVAATTIAAYWINKRHFAPIPGTSGPKPEFLIGNIRNFLAKNNDLWSIWKNIGQYGQFVALWVGPKRVILVSDPSITAEILRDKDTFIPDPTITEAIGSILTFGMIALEGDIWKRHRKALTPVLGNERIKHLMTKMDHTVNVTIKSIKERIRDTDEPIDIKEDLQIMAMDAMGYLAFGRSFRDIDANDNEDVPPIDPHILRESVDILSTELGNRMLAMGVSLHRLIGDSKKLRNAKNELSKIVRILLDEYEVNRKEMDENNLGQTQWDKFMSRSFIAQVLTSSEGRDFTFEELRGEMINFILVGSDTTSGTMAYAIKLLSEHPHVQEKLYEEIIDVIGKDATPRYDQLQEINMPYLDKVVKEVQRLALVVPALVRSSSKEISIRNVVFPKNTTFWLALSQMHRDPKYWKDPLAFLPERWEADGIVNGGPVNPKAFLPFGAGSRACFGMRLAVLELRFMLVYLTRAFFFKELPSHLKDRVGEETVAQKAIVELVNVVALPVARP